MVEMSAGVDSCEPDTGEEVVFVECDTDEMSKFVGDDIVKDAAALLDDAAAAVSETLSNIPLNSDAEAFDCSSDLTAVTTTSVVRENDSVQASTNHWEKQNVVCKVIHNGGRSSKLNVFIV